MLSLFVFLVALSSIAKGSVLYRDRYGNLVRYEAGNDELSVYQRGQNKLGKLLDNLEPQHFKQVPASNADQHQQKHQETLDGKKDNYASTKKSPLSKFKDLALSKKESTLPSDQPKKAPAPSDQPKKAVSDNKKKAEKKKYVASLFDDDDEIEVKDSPKKSVQSKKDAEPKKEAQDAQLEKKDTVKALSSEKKDSPKVIKKEPVEKKDFPKVRGTPAKKDSQAIRKPQKSIMDEKLEKTRLETIKLIQMADSKNLEKMDKLFKELFSSANDQEEKQRKSLRRDFAPQLKRRDPSPSKMDPRHTQSDMSGSIKLIDRNGTPLSNQADTLYNQRQQQQRYDYEAFKRYLQQKRQKQQDGRFQLHESNETPLSNRRNTLYDQRQQQQRLNDEAFNRYLQEKRRHQLEQEFRDYKQQKQQRTFKRKDPEYYPFNTIRD